MHPPGEVEGDTALFENEGTLERDDHRWTRAAGAPNILLSCITCQRPREAPFPGSLGRSMQ